MSVLTLDNLENLTKEVKVPVFKIPTWAKWTLGIGSVAFVILIIVLFSKKSETQGLTEKNQQLTKENEDLKKAKPLFNAITKIGKYNS